MDIEENKNNQYSKFPLCECGCGNHVVRKYNRFILGHMNTPENRKKQSERMVLNNPMKRSEVARKNGESQNHRNEPKISNPCLCGCGQLVKHGLKFINGHNTRVNHPTSIDGVCKKISEKKKGKPTILKGTTYEEVMGKERADKRKKILVEKRLGKTFEQLYGEDRAKEMKKKMSEFKLLHPVNFDEQFYLEHGYKRSSEPYTDEFNDGLKKKISERDLYTCQMCNELLPNRFNIHHINYDKKNCSDYNLIFLCCSCHMKTNFNRGFWQPYFESYQKERGILNGNDSGKT